MVFQVNLTTLLAIGAALGMAAGAALAALRAYTVWRRLPKLIVMVQGNPESDDPEERDGHAGRLSDAETTLEAHNKVLRAFCRALRIPATSDEHEIVEAIKAAIIDGRIVETTGSHRAIVLEPSLPPPARHPTPYRGPPIPREDEPPPRKR